MKAIDARRQTLDARPSRFGWRLASCDLRPATPKAALCF